MLNCSASHCSVVFTLLSHMTSYSLGRICFVYASDITYCNYHCSVQLTCLHYVVWIVSNQNHSWILLLLYFSLLCSGCSHFCKNGSARGLITQNSMFAGMCHSWVVVLEQRWYWYKMHTAFIYTLAHHDFVTSIQYVQAIDINMFSLWTDTNCLVVIICMYIVQKTGYVIKFWELLKLQNSFALVPVLARCKIVFQYF